MDGALGESGSIENRLPNFSGAYQPGSPGEYGMETQDPCLPLRGILGPGHTPR